MKDTYLALVNESDRMLNKNVIYELFGIVVGHFYYFLYFVIPKLPFTKGVCLLSSPKFFMKLTDWLGLDSKRELFLEEGDFVDDDFLERLQNNEVQI
mmetsp:Transcript_20908/g.23255  ORF Transcript_20908/g.23255 Transcript_20908/m.23255 type:complete len:97 (-) Transcript_20908:8-298(-)